METVAVIDFETTGLSPAHGDRATEIAAVLVRDGCVIGRYQSLMNAGVYVSSFIEAYTGITNEMVRSAPPASKVMSEVSEFVGACPLVAHNASFDRKFWDAELALVRKTRKQEFACSMLVARRIFPHAPNHKLGTLVEYVKLPAAGRAHRAMADAEVTASLLVRMEAELIRQFKLKLVTHEMLRSIQITPRYNLSACLERYR